MLYINGVPFFGSLHIDGLVDIDQTYNPTSENPQSGIAVAEALGGMNGGESAVLLEAYSTSHEEINTLIQEGKQVVVWENTTGETRYYHLTYSIEEYVHTFTCCSGSYVYTLSYNMGAAKPSYEENLNLQQQMVNQQYNPRDTFPISGAGVAKALETAGGDCVVYLTKEEANYELLKGYIDEGKTVIIKDDSGYLYLSAYDDDYVSFYTNAGGNYGYIDYYSGGAVDEYWSPPTINEEDVQHEYDANSTKPISGQGMAKALETVGSNGYELIGDITLPEDATAFSFTELLNGKSLEDYKDFFMYFYGKFTADFASPNAIAIRANEGAVYFMWRGFGTRKAGALFGFWCEIEEICKNADMRLWKTTDEMLYNIFAAGNTQGLSDNNNQVYGDFALTYVKDFTLNRIQMFIGSNNDSNSFVAGSRCMLFGRLR